jgi:hypothetical protein
MDSPLAVSDLKRHYAESVPFEIALGRIFPIIIARRRHGKIRQGTGKSTKKSEKLAAGLQRLNFIFPFPNGPLKGTSRKGRFYLSPSPQA